MLSNMINLSRGTLVCAARRLDSAGANVSRYDFGVVFEEADFYDDNTGPMVRWVNGGTCNVYAEDIIVLSKL